MNIVVKVVAALRALPDLVQRVEAIEARQRAMQPSVQLAGRVSDLEHNLDEVEALAREVNIGKPTRSRGVS